MITKFGKRFLTDYIAGNSTFNTKDIALGKEYAPEIKAAQDAIYMMAKRGVAKGRFVFTGPEMQAMNTGMEVHDAQLDACTIGELEAAIKYVYEAIKHRRARAIVEAAV